MSARRIAAGLAFALGLAALPRTSSAQEYLPAGHLQVASGIEGNGQGMQRARTRVRIGLELRVDEFPQDALSFSGLVEIEPRAAAGFDFRYVRTLGKLLAAHAGAIGYVAPGTLLGGVAGIEARAKVATGTYITAGPDFTVFVFGSDLPNNTIVWQTLFQVGARVDF